MKIKLLTTIRKGNGNNSEYCPKGSITELPDNDANELIDRGLAEATEVSNPVPTSSNIDEIIEAFSLLKPEDFSKDGKPKVPSLELVLETKISGADRDAAWAKYQELNAQNE